MFTRKEHFLLSSLFVWRKHFHFPITLKCELVYFTQQMVVSVCMNKHLPVKWLSKYKVKYMSLTIVMTASDENWRWHNYRPSLNVYCYLPITLHFVIKTFIWPEFSNNLIIAYFLNIRVVLNMLTIHYLYYWGYLRHNVHNHCKTFFFIKWLKKIIIDPNLKNDHLMKWIILQANIVVNYIFSFLFGNDENFYNVQIIFL